MPSKPTGLKRRKLDDLKVHYHYWEDPELDDSIRARCRWCQGHNLVKNSTREADHLVGCAEYALAVASGVTEPHGFDQSKSTRSVFRPSDGLSGMIDPGPHNAFDRWRSLAQISPFHPLQQHRNARIECAMVALHNYLL